MESWNEQDLIKLFEHCADVKFHRVSQTASQAGTESVELLVLYCEGMCNNNLLREVVLPWLMKGSLFQEYREVNEQSWDKVSLLTSKLKPNVSEQVMMDEVFRGNSIVLHLTEGGLFKIETSDRPERSPSESTSELTVFGPKDCFIEGLSTNIALVRKRLRSNTLCCEKFVIGTRSRTEVALLYLGDVLDPEVARNIRTKLNNLKVEAVTALEELKVMLIKPGIAFFPLMSITTRTDMATDSLIKGRFVIMMDGLPSVLIAPVTISYMLTAAEDIHTSVPLIYIERMMRRIGLFITTLLPGFWVALTSYHQDQIPFPLLATITVASMGTPLSGPLEILLMTLLFQFFLEGGSRLPSALGPSVSVVGGLIIGDAIIKAGLTSPATLVIAAVTATAQFTLAMNQFGNSVGLLRIYIFILASFFGLFGFFTGAFSVLIYTANLKSFGVPYLAPYSPFNWDDFRFALFRFPRGKRQRRPVLLHTQKDPPGRGGGNPQ